MAKPKNDAITEHDLVTFVENVSDFGFEMRVLRELQNLMFECAHGGTYEDPITHKIRQFDIRAARNSGNLKLVLAVECKNIRPNYPLLLSAVARNEHEAFHNRIEFQVGGLPQFSRIVAVRGRDSAYPVGDMVGKRTDQVGRNADGLFSDDSTTFDKLNQAVNSCKDLIQSSVNEPSPPLIRVVVPMLVVPANVLWQVDYSVDGTVLVAPRKVRRATLFLGQRWPVKRSIGAQVSYELSHLEIITIEGLGESIDQLSNLLLP
jgi:hypothetical protein